MARRKRHKYQLRQLVECTDGIPNYLIPTVSILQAAYPAGMVLNSPEYVELFTFLDEEDFTHRAIATAMEFAFDIDYYDVMNSWAVPEEETLWHKTIEIATKRFAAHGLEQWRDSFEHNDDAK